MNINVYSDLFMTKFQICLQLYIYLISILMYLIMVEILDKFHVKSACGFENC